MENKNRISPNPEGYSIEMFLTKPGEEYICGICQQVGRNLTETNCGHIFCSSCITSWLDTNKTCPVNRESLEKSGCHPMFYARRKISTMNVCCPNKCSIQCLVKDLQSHLDKECCSRKIKCGVCDKSVIASELEEHMQSAWADHIQSLSKTVKTLTSTNSLLVKQVKQLENDKADMIKTIEAVKDTITQPLFDSSIITKQNKCHFFGLITQLLFGKNYRLLFRASRDGFTARAFHLKADNVPKTLVVIRSDNYIFGGYSTKKWEKTQGVYSNCNSRSWLFSLNKYQIIRLKPGNTNIIYNRANSGPTFGSGHDLHICNNSHTNKQSYSNLGSCYDLNIANVTYGNENAKTYLAGSYKFLVSDYEVFEVH